METSKDSCVRNRDTPKTRFRWMGIAHVLKLYHRPPPEIDFNTLKSSIRYQTFVFKFSEVVFFFISQSKVHALQVGNNFFFSRYKLYHRTHAIIITFKSSLTILTLNCCSWNKITIQGSTGIFKFKY